MRFMSMKLSCVLVSLATVFISASTAMSEERVVPLNISLMPPFAIAGSGDSVVSNISWGIVTKTARIEGASFSVVNIHTKSVRGLQSAWLVGTSGGSVDGLQSSLIVSSAKGDVNGAQVAVVVNHAGGSVDGMQVTGLISHASSSTKQISGIMSIAPSAGYQLSGLMSHAASAGNQTSGLMSYAPSAGNQVSGFMSHASTARLQASGFMNYVRDTVGVQIAGIVNVAHKSTVQSGLINVTGHSEGTQLGFINIAQQQDGVPLGAFSYVKGVPVRLNTWSDETGFANIGIVSGLPNIYSMFVVGYRSYDTPKWWSVGYGFGAHVTRGANFYQFDWVTTAMFNEDDPEFNENISRLRFALGRQLASLCMPVQA
jgi:hypothetical protein